MIHQIEANEPGIIIKNSSGRNTHIIITGRRFQQMSNSTRYIRQFRFFLDFFFRFFRYAKHVILKWS